MAYAKSNNTDDKSTKYSRNPEDILKLAKKILK